MAGIVEDQRVETDSTFFPIVGIGASAGGLAAATELVKYLPNNTGMGFVLVQHLSPHHESILAELLARHSRMPVTQAVNGTTVDPNHVYVIPPNARMTIRQGVLLIAPREKAGSAYLPIDEFFCSLAASQRSRAIGVILSGTACDGTVGLKDIKEAGGMTFAQDTSATFDSMPRNAIAAGAVDLVLSPALIAGELAAISRHSHFDQTPLNPPVQNGATLRHVLSLLRKETNVDLIHYKTPTILRRLSRRLALHNLEQLEPYVEMLERDPEELHRLFDDLLINVTGFFRDPATFEVLARDVFPQLIAERKNEGSLRIWVPGCSSGEEVYSLAICLREHLDSVASSLSFQIFGTDISERCIQSARLARYPEAISEVVSAERLTRFFSKIESGYQVCRSIRDLCIFSRQDVTRDPPLSRMDLISCRNLLIYLGPVLQKRVIGIFNYALSGEGFLVLGSSEAIGAHSDHYIAVDREHKIYRKNLKVAAPPFDFPVRSRVKASARLDPLPLTPDLALVLDHQADQLLAHEYAPPGLLVNATYQVLRFRGDVGAFLAPAAGDATLDALKLVRAELSGVLRLALDEASAKKSPVRREAVRYDRDNSALEVNVIVRPIGENGSDRHFLVLFERVGDVAPSRAPRGWTEAEPDQSQAVAEAARELAAAREYMQGLVEELRSANEEAQSSNEELQSTNEELQTAKEELQSTNEELSTINDEMRGRNLELSQVNNDLINLLSSMQVPILMLNSQLRIRRYTPSAERVLSLIPTDIGRPVTDLKPRINLPNLEELLKGVISSLAPFEQEVQDLDGHWYSLRIRPYRTSENRIDGAVLQLLDVNQLKQTLAKVEYARDYAEAILSTIQEPLVVLDHELRIQTANRSFFETFRVSTPETLNRIIFEVGNGQWNFPKVHKMLEAVLQDSGGVLQNVEIEHDFERLGRRTFELNARRVDTEGKTRLILLALQDISDRKKAAEARYRRVFETAKDAICILDAEDGIITDVNPFLVELFGFTRDQLVGNRFWEVAPLNAMEDGPELLARLQAGEIVRLPEVPLKHKDRRVIESELVGNMYTEGDKRVVQFNIRDIRQRKHFEQQLQQTAKLESLGLLAGGIAHDFNNLLTGIMGNASLALAHAPAGSSYQEELTEVVAASHRAANLTRQMLAYAGKGRFVIRPISLSETVRDITALIHTSIPLGVELKFNLDGQLPKLQADASQIQQVIMNLVINGAEAIREGSFGTVIVTTRLERVDAEHIRQLYPNSEIGPGSYIALEVSDTGVGMDETTRSKMFDPFFTTKFTGRGLGLAAVQGIIRGHRGAIRVQSAVNYGTTVTVIFPAVEAAPLPAEPASVELKKSPQSGLVLVVDDEDMILRIAAPALRNIGYEVLTARSGPVAIETVRKRGADLALVILDLTMPVMGGIETATIIKEIVPNLPVLLSSGYDQSHALNGVEESKLDGFVQKPYTADILLEHVNRVLSQPLTAEI